MKKHRPYEVLAHFIKAMPFPFANMRLNRSIKARIEFNPKFQKNTESIFSIYNYITVFLFCQAYIDRKLRYNSRRYAVLFEFGSQMDEPDSFCQNWTVGHGLPEELKEVIK